MFRKPVVTLSRGSVHAAFHKAKIGRLAFARPVALPYVCPVAVDLIMEGMVDSYFVVAMVVDGIREQLETRSMPSTIVSARMFPRGRDEEVCVDGFVK
jgi:hypothetical protein